MPNKKIIRHAFNACRKSECEHQLAAVLYKGGAVIRIATNNIKTMQYRKKYFSHKEPSRHAEMNAIHGIPRDVIERCSLLVVRLDRKNRIKSAKPCEACAKALYDAGIKKVYYTSYSGDILKLNFDDVYYDQYKKEDYRKYINQYDAPKSIEWVFL